MDLLYRTQQHINPKRERNGQNRTNQSLQKACQALKPDLLQNKPWPFCWRSIILLSDQMHPSTQNKIQVLCITSQGERGHTVLGEEEKLTPQETFEFGREGKYNESMATLQQTALASSSLWKSTVIWGALKNGGKKKKKNAF